MGRFSKIAEEIGDVVELKNRAYGNAINDTEGFLKLLYPNGITEDKYHSVGLLIRMWDKMKRIASDAEAFGESPFMDIAGYAILGEEASRRGTGERKVKT